MVSLSLLTTPTHVYILAAQYLKHIWHIILRPIPSFSMLFLKVKNWEWSGGKAISDIAYQLVLHVAMCVYVCDLGHGVLIVTVWKFDLDIHDD